MIPTHVLALVEAEIERARRKHGRSVENAARENPDRALRILVEEVGEIAAAIETLEDVTDGDYATTGEHNRAIAAAADDLHAEVVQVASTAIRWLIATAPLLARHAHHAPEAGEEG